MRIKLNQKSLKKIMKAVLAFPFLFIKRSSLMKTTKDGVLIHFLFTRS